jgi:hypothetical protein
MIRHAAKIGRDGTVGTDPSMISRSQHQQDAWRERYLCGHRQTFPISRPKDLPHAEIRLVIHIGATANRLIGARPNEQSVTVNWRCLK